MFRCYFSEARRQSSLQDARDRTHGDSFSMRIAAHDRGSVSARLRSCRAGFDLGADAHQLGKARTRQLRRRRHRCGRRAHAAPPAARADRHRQWLPAQALEGDWVTANGGRFQLNEPQTSKEVSDHRRGHLVAGKSRPRRRAAPASAPLGERHQKAVDLAAGVAIGRGSPGRLIGPRRLPARRGGARPAARWRRDQPLS